MILPALIAICLWTIYPIAYSFYISLYKWYLYSKVSFVGLGNYVKLIHDDLFWKSLYQVSYYVMMSVSCQLILGLGMALLLNEKLKGRGIVKAFLLIPWALPGTTVGGIWKWIYQYDYGLFNIILRTIGISENGFHWLSSSTALNSIILVDIWRFAPFTAIILLAGLTTIPKSLYEAAIIDGANAWRRLINITLPLLLPTILVVLIIRTMFAFQVFDLIVTLTHGGPGTATYVLPYYAYLNAFSFIHIGYGAAVSYALMGSILSMIVLFSLLFKVLNKKIRV